MSLEQTLGQTNTLLQQLIAILQTGIEANATLGESDAKTTRTRKAKAEVAAAPAAATEGETTYWLIEKHNTAYAQAPGEPGPSIEGAVVVTKEVYEAKKAEFAKKNIATASQTGSVAEKQEATSAPAASPAPASSSATPAPAAESSSPADAAQFFTEQILPVMKDISASKEAGLGRDGVLKVLNQFGKTKVPELATVSDLQSVVAFAKGLLTPAAAEGVDLF